MKELVTGGAGFIGSNFVHYWLETYPGDQIIIWDALTYAGHLESLLDIFPDLKEIPQTDWDGVEFLDTDRCIFRKGEITDPSFVDHWMKHEPVEVIVHFAAETHVDRSVIDPMVFVKTNVLGTATLLNAALDNRVQRFHHVSTDEVFGSLGLDDPKFNEDTPYEPRTPYSASKAGSDHLVRAYSETYGLPVTITNCANNFGPYHDPEKLIPRFITNLLEGKKVPLMGQGENVRSWLYVKDHARAIDLVIKKG